jgi:hypothetical protein
MTDAMEVKVVHLEAWPFAARVLLQLAQGVADDQRQATVSGAHVASVLLEMSPVREILATTSDVERLDAAVERAVLSTGKGYGKTASFAGPLARLLTGEVPRTADLLRRATADTAGVAEIQAAVARHADAIAALLDAPQLSELFAAAGSNAPEHAAVRKRCPHLTNALVEAQRRKHHRVTTRHVIAAYLRTLERMLTRRGLPWNGDATARLELLFQQERQPLDGGGPGLWYTPRLVGAAAGALALPELPADELDLALLRHCFTGDASVTFAKEVMKDAFQRLASLPDAG